MIIHYIVPEIWHVKDVIFIFHFGLLFVLLLPNNPKNQNFEKKTENNACRYHHFKHVVPKIMITQCTVPEQRYGAQQTGGWMEGQSGIQRWVSHLKMVWD